MKHPRADEAKRRCFSKQLARYEQDGRPIIYLDESGFKSNDYRPYGYATKGEKCYGTDNRQLKNTTNAIGAIHDNRLFSVGLYNCSIDSTVFHHWVEMLLLPELPPRSVIVMDNATFHKRLDIQDLIEKAGHTILWLPPYSPDLNPIEQTWAWIKRKRKDWRIDCLDTLFFYFLWICDSF
ncbi:IS630 family transposase [Uruburuella testudinis]|uniref:IS630 family transposase n=1 Tax=Uruburuella testudinis TaxID=1282863 RepID=A0ABY4DSN6_9NEIS|nr:IS630 family transposase [Uruburuella testudinis]UOO82045.1 IS630 family transposase [Uruburuella testudinis]